MSTPNSKVYLIASGNMLSADLHHTYRFVNKDAQRAFFIDSLSKTVDPVQYIRVTEGVVKLAIPKEEIEGRFSYMAIETYDPYDEHVSRIWYAFIMNLEYISDMCTAVYYKIDPIQTFIFGDGGAGLNWANVDRCHSDTDDIGDNRVNEPFNVTATELNVEGTSTSDGSDSWGCSTGVVIGIVNKTRIKIPSLSVDRDTVATSYYNGLYVSGAEYFYFTSATASYMTELLENLNDANAIVDFYICPSACLPTSGYTIGTGMPQQNIYKQLAFGARAVTGIGGYVPKNNKLFTYPYVKLEVTTTVGDKLDLKFEEFGSGIKTFSIQGSWAGSPSLLCTPRNYAGSRAISAFNPQNNNYDYQLALNGFPVCGYNADLYKIWKAQKELPEKMQIFNHALGAANEGMMKGALLTGLGAFTGSAQTASRGLLDAAGGLLHGINSFSVGYGDLKAHEMEAKLKPEQQLQAASGDNLLALSHSHLAFIFQRKSIKAYEAKMIDDFFTQYGYAQNKLMDVDTWVHNQIRTRFKYIKTIDLHVNGACPAAYKEEIETIFNRGITFWESGQTIGDYSTDNPIVT